MSQPGAARRALSALIDAGVTGTYRSLAHAAGVSEQRARATLKEMSRCGRARACGRGPSPAVYGPPSMSVDVLAFARSAWR